MHWLLVLAILSSTTNLKGGSSTDMNRLAENTLRERIGGANAVRVDVAPVGKWGRGEFDHFNVTLDGFDADRLMGLDDRTASTVPDDRQGPPRADSRDPRDTRDPRGDARRDSRTPNYRFPDRFPDDAGPVLRWRDGRSKQRNTFDIEDIFKGDLGDVLGGNGDIGGVLGDILGGKSNGGRIGRINIAATNFTFQGTRYDFLSANLGELKFDWGKALRGDIEIQSLQPGNLDLRLRADQATRLVAPRLPSVQDVRLRFDGGRAFVGGKAAYLGVNVPFEVGGRLSVHTNQVMADDFRVSLAGLRLPSFVVDEITKGVNPLYDFDPQRRWPIAVNLNTAGTDNNALALRGGIQWVGFNRDKSYR